MTTTGMTKRAVKGRRAASTTTTLRPGIAIPGLFLMQHSWQHWFEEELTERRDAHLLRARVALHHVDATHVELDGRPLVSFASNNYLGLTHHPRVIEAVQRAAREHGVGSGAAALITGYTGVHASAEQALARWKGTEAGVLLPSGYQANHAVVQTFAGIAERAGGVRFLIDKLVHASLVDAVRGSGLPFRVFPHNGLGKLRRLLIDGGNTGLQVVITESIFSMDGDAADLAGLAALKRQHPFALVLDEAHAAGVYGPGGAGLAAELGVQDAVDVSVATLSKAIGCVGGVICASRTFCDALTNLGRSYIFSTSVPPFVAAVAEAAVGVMRDEPARQARVRELARRVRAARDLPGDAPIVPVMIGGDPEALAASERLKSQGFLVPAVRPPTVPKGTSRLRVTLSCEHTDQDVARLIDALQQAAGLSVPFPA
jgi:8-amino-7-oxononanoate synthase